MRNHNVRSCQYTGLGFKLRTVRGIAKGWITKYFEKIKIEI